MPTAIMHGAPAASSRERGGDPGGSSPPILARGLVGQTLRPRRISPMYGKTEHDGSGQRSSADLRHNVIVTSLLRAYTARMARTIIVGDVHGCAGELGRLIDE